MRNFLLIAVSLLIAMPASATDSITAIVDREMQSLSSLYRHLHANPELSGMEKNTSVLLARELKAAGYEVIERIGRYEEGSFTGYGVAAVMRNGEGPVVLVRGDMDGLPVKEETSLPFASKVTSKTPTGAEVNVMHACAHDLHMTSLIGTARTLAALKDRWRGTVVLIGQPAEEIGAGANAMLNDALYTRVPKPDYAIALHVSANLESGKIGVREGYALANIDAVDVTIRGVGGHGATPYAAKDPIVVAAQFIMALQTIISRENSPLDPAVITVGSIHGGAKRNVIPDEVKLQLTVRSYKDEVRDRLLAAIERIAKNTAEAAGIPQDRAPIVEVIERERGRATYNDPELTRRLAQAWRSSLGADRVTDVEPVMVSEDFGNLGLEGRKIPISLFWLGTVDKKQIDAAARGDVQLPPLHSSRYAPDAVRAITTGVEATTAAVLELLAPKK